MHIGPYSTEPESMKKIETFILKEGLINRVGNGGKHHEIYLSDPRKSKPESMKTVLRLPVEKV
jgi:hypothetical protein